MGILGSTSHVIQLLIALGGGVLIFTLAFCGYSRAFFIGIVIMIPFQPIDSQYGSVNMAITYVVGFAMLLNGIRYRSNSKMSAPLIVSFLLLILVFL